MVPEDHLFSSGLPIVILPLAWWRRFDPKHHGHLHRRRK
jgi:hypothetical protein